MCETCWTNTQAAIVATESIRKIADFGRVGDLQPDGRLNCQRLCAPEGIRTPNLLIRSQMLYPLSYGRLSSIVGVFNCGLTPPVGQPAEARGFEPPVPFEGDNSLAVSPIRPLWHAS
jgi:hypothetical protein